MHMADALISPAVGGTMLLAASSAAAYSIKKVQRDLDDKKIPLMGVMGAFVFAAQMINFTIPGTGSSGHLGGGMLLAILMGPYGGFLTMASILIIQALFFADGGILSLGCNIINLGFYTCFISYPFIFKKIVSKGYSKGRIFLASMISAIIGLQFGAFSVVLETYFSGKTELPFINFLMLMQPIHLAIGIVEGFVTAAVVVFIWKARPEILEGVLIEEKKEKLSFKRVITIIAVIAVLIGGIFSWFASSKPDGLEWSMFNVSGKEELSVNSTIHEKLALLQEKIAFLPDYNFKNKEMDNAENEDIVSNNVGTSVSGLVGGLMTLSLTTLTGLCIYHVKKRKKLRA